MISKTLVRMPVSVLFLTLSWGCSPESNSRPAEPWVKDTQVKALSTLKPSVSPLNATIAAAPVSTVVPVSVVATVDRKALFEQEFLYGADLQYSSFFEAGDDLYLQSLALGHFPARFRIVGDELQLVLDARYSFPSDVNHPEKLLSRFKILAQNEATLTISNADSRAFLGTLVTELGAKGQPADLWVRSFESAEKGTYLLQQTSVMMPDGSIGEFLEAIFPRAMLAPSANFQVFRLDPTDPVGASEGPAARFRFLGGEKTYEGEEAVTFAQHFDLPPNGTIDWYVTRNIPDEYLRPVQEGIEGWNRYFLSFKGIERPVMRFLGRLPEGIHLGDPRYNVINWDSRLVAGAAYESQAVDPLTGKQSHSLIYLPAAWLQMGADYWKEGFASEAETRQSSRLLSRVACARDLRDGKALAVSGRLSRDEIEAFSVQLLKGTLFHEVGHALGLAHNFKGSLSFDRSEPGSLFSSSIMDYNDYEVERAAFTAVDSADGPLLEYDRQALSALYNQSRDYDAGSEALPACNDEEADAEEGGVDPLCVRYDAEKDPTLSIETAYSRIMSEKLPGDVSLSEALVRVPGLLLTPAKLSETKTKEQFTTLAELAAGSLNGTLNYYFLSGKASFARAVRINVRSLLEVAEGVIPEGYDLRAMRERAFSGIDRAIRFKALPDTVAAALSDAQERALQALAETAYVKSLSPAEAEELLGAVRKKLTAKLSAFSTSEAAGLPKLRSAVLGSLARREAVPFFFGTLGGTFGGALGGTEGETLVDFEAIFVGILGEAVGADSGRTTAERLSAAKALATYAGRMQGDVAIASVRAKLLEERAIATNNKSRELVELLLKTLN